MRRLPFILTLMTIMALGSSCSSDKSNSTLKENAEPTGGYYVRLGTASGNSINYALVSRDKGYLVTCSDLAGLSALIEATGQETFVLDAAPYYPYGSYDHLKIDEQPVLSCDPSGKTLYFVDRAGTRKYFFEDENVAISQLFMIGCHDLVAAMGFDITKAKQFDESAIDYNWVTVDDEDDINCVTGIPVRAPLSWDGDDLTLDLEAGEHIHSLYQAFLPGGEDASVEVTREGFCDWVNEASRANGATFHGIVPATFVDRKCVITLTAEKGTVFEESKVLELRNGAIHWYEGQEGELTLLPETDLLISYVAYYSYGAAAELTVERSGDCSWIGESHTGSRVNFFGVPPAEMVFTTCTLNVIAAAGSEFESIRTLELAVGKIEWVQGDDIEISLNVGETVSLEYETNIAQATLSTERSGSCEWLGESIIPGKVSFSGDSSSALGKTCQVIVWAEKGTIFESFMTLTLTMDLVWTQGDDLQLDLEWAETVLLEYETSSAYATISTEFTGSCSWLQETISQGKVVFEGINSSAFAGTQCQVVVWAEKDTIFESFKTLTLNTSNGVIANSKTELSTLLSQDDPPKSILINFSDLSFLHRDVIAPIDPNYTKIVVSHWDTSRVVNMFAAFWQGFKFNQDISNWNTSSVTSMAFMFSDDGGCAAGYHSFNQEIQNWDVSSVTTMRCMFQCNSSFNQSLSNWQVGKVADFRWMFSSALSFNQNLDNWQVLSTSDRTNMFLNSPMASSLPPWY